MQPLRMEHEATRPKEAKAQDSQECEFFRWNPTGKGS
jgi:hypothetical protein